MIVHYYSLKKYFKFLKVLFHKFFLLKQRYTIIREYFRSFKQIDTQKTYSYVYDTQNSPPKYGDFMHCLFLLRYLSFQVTEINFYFLMDMNNQDWNLLKNKSKVFNDIKILIKFILPSNVKSHFIYANEFFKIESNKLNLIYKDYVLRRKPIYLHSINMLSYIYKKKSCSKFLFDRLQIEELVPIFFRNLDYVVLSARFDKNGDNFRDMTEYEFIKTIEIIKSKTNKNLVVVSDELGTKHFSKISEKYDLKVIFSRDHTSNFLENSLVCSHASYFIQFKGGGLATLPIYSKRPYFINAISHNDLYYKKNHIASWAEKRQTYICNDNFVKFFNGLKELKLDINQH